MGLIVDNFAGGGGASTGMELALGRKVDIAINHDPDAIAMHKANHPNTTHYQESVWNIDPMKICNGEEVDAAWFSPDCKHFSKAKGKKPVDKKIRGLAWIALRWAGTVRPKIIFLENVVEFKTWGPVRHGQPIKSKQGQTFDKFISQLKELGYEIAYRELVAADYGAPTKRKRFFLIARSDNQPIEWPQALFAPRDKAKALGMKPYKSAESIIDWSIKCPSIFERKKPLSEATMKRIARGMEKFVFKENKPFIVPIGYGEGKNQLPRIHSLEEPLPTLVSSGKHYLVMPYVIDYHYENQPSSVLDPTKTLTTVRGQYLVTPYLMINNTGHPGSMIKQPVPTITTGIHHFLLSPLLVQIGQNGFCEDRSSSIREPIKTVVTKNEFCLLAPVLIPHGYPDNDGKRTEDIKQPVNVITSGGNKHALAIAFLVKHFGGYYEGHGASLEQPLGTVTAVDHHALVEAFLIKYYKGADNVQSVKEPLHTITAKSRFGIVTINHVDYQIVDIGMRMLTPRELYNAQGFPKDYVIDKDCYGNKYPINKQIARCGNAVPPPFAEALLRANMSNQKADKQFESMKDLQNYHQQISLF